MTGALGEGPNGGGPEADDEPGPKQLWGAGLAFDVHTNGDAEANAVLVDLVAGVAGVTDVARPLLRHPLHLTADWWTDFGWDFVCSSPLGTRAR